MTPSKTSEPSIATKETLLGGSSADESAESLGIELTDEMRAGVDQNLELLLTQYHTVLKVLTRR
ncbi:hypothetical protein D1227_16755 [Henriciella mobilis]|nr:hypothetical protein [Henriciella mobilis]RIJ16895.1 hypothetical protein D1231_07010 [Henriciella mobilis]RIJ19325.1 hypothetical protein D1227_16755 [Henriciella mobilis]